MLVLMLVWVTPGAPHRRSSRKSDECSPHPDRRKANGVIRSYLLVTEPLIRGDGFWFTLLLRRTKSSARNSQTDFWFTPQILCLPHVHGLMLCRG